MLHLFFSHRFTKSSTDIPTHYRIKLVHVHVQTPHSVSEKFDKSFCHQDGDRQYASLQIMTLAHVGIWSRVTGTAGGPETTQGVLATRLGPLEARSDWLQWGWSVSAASPADPYKWQQKATSCRGCHELVFQPQRICMNLLTCPAKSMSIQSLEYCSLLVSMFW